MGVFNDKIWFANLIHSKVSSELGQQNFPFRPSQELKWNNPYWSQSRVQHTQYLRHM